MGPPERELADDAVSKGAKVICGRNRPDRPGYDAAQA